MEFYGEYYVQHNEVCKGWFEITGANTAKHCGIWHFRASYGAFVILRVSWTGKHTGNLEPRIRISNNYLDLSNTTSWLEIKRETSLNSAEREPSDGDELILFQNNRTRIIRAEIQNVARTNPLCWIGYNGKWKKFFCAQPVYRDKQMDAPGKHPVEWFGLLTTQQNLSTTICGLSVFSAKAGKFISAHLSSNFFYNGSTLRTCSSSKNRSSP